MLNQRTKDISHHQPFHRPFLPEMKERIALLLAFATVYLLWGSTFLAIRFAVESIPPFLMAGARFLTAGGALYVWARLRGAPRPERAHLRTAFITAG